MYEAGIPKIVERRRRIFQDIFFLTGSELTLSADSTVITAIYVCKRPACDYTELSCPGLITVVCGSDRFNSTFRRCLCTASSGAVSLWQSNEQSCQTRTKKIAQDGVSTRQCAEHILRSVIHACARNVSLECLTDPYKF